MAEIQWTWGDASLVHRASPFHWSSSPLALETINELQRQSLKNQRRPVRMIFKGKELRFLDATQAIVFLRPHADQDRITSAARHRQPCENIESLRVRGALHCPAGHPIQDRYAIANWWFQTKRTCQVCETSISDHSAHWHCSASCDYRVCNHCFQNAVWSATQLFARKSGCPSLELHNASEASTSESTADGRPQSSSTSDASSSNENSAADGPRVELQVQAVELGSRREIFTFDSRPLSIQLAELVDALGLSSRDCRPDFYLVRSCGTGLEILHSELQILPLVPLTPVSIERADVLVRTCLDALAHACSPDIDEALQNLLSLVCVSENLAEEAFRQGAFSALTSVLRQGSSTVDLACTGICALLAAVHRRNEAMSVLRDRWHELGSSLVHNLLAELFVWKGQRACVGAKAPNATLSFFLWLLEDIVGAAATAHAVSQGKLEANGLAMYPLLVQASEGRSGEGFLAHAGRLVLWMMLRTSTHQVAQPELQQDIEEEIKRCASTPGALAWLEELVAEHGLTELLATLTACCASPADLELQHRQQEVDQLREEKKFSGMLQSKLRQIHKTVVAMIPFIKLGDAHMENALDAVIRHGWESAEWPDGYTMLHFLCEYSSDMHLINLVAGLCTDLETRDAKGNRAMDYALDNTNAEVAQCLVEVAQERVAAGLCSTFFEPTVHDAAPSITVTAPSSSPQKQGQAERFVISSPVSTQEPASCLENQDRSQERMMHSPASHALSMTGSKPSSNRFLMSRSPITCDKELVMHSPALHMTGSKPRPSNAFMMSTSPPRYGEFLAFLEETQEQCERQESEHLSPEIEEQLEHFEASLGEPTSLHAAFDKHVGASKAPDCNVGAVFMLKTQLTTATRENAALRDKAGEVEMLRTRLAILTEENSALQNSISFSSRTNRASDLQGQLSVSTAGNQSPTSLHHKEADPSKAEVTPAVESTATQLAPADQTQDAASIPPTKGKGKGKSTPSEADSPSPVEPPLTGKGKKGKGKGKLPPPKAGEISEQGKGKGKGKGDVAEPTKPPLAPTKELKSVPWTRFVKGAQIEQGTTIWDEVNKTFDMESLMDLVPIAEIEQRFSKSANDTSKSEKPEKKQVKKSKTAKLDSITQENRFQIEVSLKTLPLSVNNGAKAVNAIKDLNRALLSADAVNTLHRFLCPNQEQRQELVMKRQLGMDEYLKQLEGYTTGDEVAKPEPFQWDPVEQYMEHLAHVPSCSMRLSCWGFLYNLPERVNHLQDNLDRFDKMVHCFHTSQEMSSLLGIVLAFGNYLNGGKNEKRLGQADGFHVEMLGRPGGLDVVNDTQGRNVRQLIFQVFFSKFPEKSARLMSELEPMFALVQRRVIKDSDGVADLKKSVRVQIEDLDKQLMQLKHEFATKQEELKEGLQLIEDPADKFVVEIPKEFDRERQRVDELDKRKNLVLQQFKALLSMYKAETYRGDSCIENGRVKDGNPKEPMTSEVWCKIWDDFFVSKSMFLGVDEKKQKELLEPCFCKDTPMTVDGLKTLWHLQKAKKPKQTSSEKKDIDKTARRHSM